MRVKLYVQGVPINLGKLEDGFPTINNNKDCIKIKIVTAQYC